VIWMQEGVIHKEAGAEGIIEYPLNKVVY
jgi:hypothetical protein